ncbi:hypothetical protein VCR31J2_1350066 [Vibrio coralliirubri]|uniref:Uncharacterized protein n=1 Tax=Vibrio coralliirubri TaxID=1516159 RepID=A0AA86XUA3_9VIBR|nr:hypothetical protein VCR31J2_1350066 [Vibrio coralliirubri]
MRTTQDFLISSYSTIKNSNEVIEVFNKLGRPVIYYDWYINVPTKSAHYSNVWTYY